MSVPPSGPIPAHIMIVGEAPGYDEERTRTPFMGAAGAELDRMLHECKLNRTQCFLTLVCRTRPPNNRVEVFFADSKKAITSAHYPLRDKFVKQPIIDGITLLQKEISLVKPNVIIALGNVALWALTGKWGIQKWRGSMLETDTGIKVIPTIAPYAILQDWSWRAMVVNDIKRAARYSDGRPFPKPQYNLIIRPTFDIAQQQLNTLFGKLAHAPMPLSFDVETSHGHIDCAGIAWSKTEAICIPFVEVLTWRTYWSAEQEAQLVWLLYRILTHPNARVTGQNILYDSQYTYRHWHFVPNIWRDSMISFHCAFAGLKKSLDFQASLLCEYYVQWKPDKVKQKEGG